MYCTVLNFRGDHVVAGTRPGTRYAVAVRVYGTGRRAGVTCIMYNTLIHIYVHVHV